MYTQIALLKDLSRTETSYTYMPYRKGYPCFHVRHNW